MLLDQTNWPHISVEVDVTSELLIRARGFIERGWCRHTEARNRFGMAVDPRSKWAVAWCMAGALDAATEFGGHAVRGFALRRLGAVIPHRDIAAFNDAQESIEPVLAVFDRAIEARNR